MNFHPIDNSSDTAEVIVPILIDWYNPKSVLDLGCNSGQWLKWFKKFGVYAVGIDGDNMIPELVIPRHSFIVADLTKEIDLKGKFDLVLCLEVAEHLEEQYADTLVDTSIRHSDTIFWSSATPNQGGWNHYNEQPLEYWIEKFKARGYEARLLKDELPQVPHDYYRKNAIEFKKMRTYAQNREDLKALRYFGDRNINVLSVGENTGLELSNAKLLIEHGANAWLLEPGETCGDLFALHKDNPRVKVFNYGFGDKVEKVTFYESGAHVRNGTDKGLVSSTSYEETLKWRQQGVSYKETTIQLVPFDGFYDRQGRPPFHFISIDTESNDWKILQQINLTETHTEFLVIEWNGVIDLKRKFVNYCGQHGLKQVGENNENLLFAKTP
jgi:SAM-dependent methyltransferase